MEVAPMAETCTVERTRPRALLDRAVFDSAPEWSGKLSSPDGQGAQLVVRRRDIEFTELRPGRVQIAISVMNGGLHRSPLTTARIQVAPFGAFVDWKPLMQLEVQPMDPGESTVLRTDAERVFPRPLGPPDRVPPRRLLTALDFDEEQPAGRDPASRARPRTLSASPFDLLTGRETYWAGNLNIFVGGTDVERHAAKALRIVPGRTNVAMFVVGDRGGAESYRFDLKGLDVEWEGAIFDPMHARSLAYGLRDGKQIETGSWHTLPGRSMLLLALKPPMRSDVGGIEVHVTQQSTQKTAVVEFSFDARALGPGCYVVE
jgi:hypothetical protein